MKYNHMRRFVVYRQVHWRCEVCDPLEAQQTHNNIKYTHSLLYTEVVKVEKRM